MRRALRIIENERETQTGAGGNEVHHLLVAVEAGTLTARLPLRAELDRSPPQRLSHVRRYQIRATATAVDQREIVASGKHPVHRHQGFPDQVLVFPLAGTCHENVRAVSRQHRRRLRQSPRSGIRRRSRST